MIKLDVRQLAENRNGIDIRRALDHSGIDDYCFDAFVEHLYECGISVKFEGDTLADEVTILPYDEVHGTGSEDPRMWDDHEAHIWDDDDECDD